MSVSTAGSEMRKRSVRYESAVIIGGVESSVTVAARVIVVDASVTENDSTYVPSGAVVPSLSVPSQVNVCAPGLSDPTEGEATTSVPRSTCSSAATSGRVTVNENETTPCFAAEKTAGDDVIASTASSIVNETAADTDVPLAPAAVSWIVYCPGSSPGAGANTKLCAPAGFGSEKSVESTSPAP